MDEKKVKNRKDANMILKQSRIAGKRQTCALCGNICSSFCNSHTIPSFIIQRIATNGHVLLPSEFSLYIDRYSKKEFDKWTDAIKGVNNTWTFHSICCNCDKKYFGDYESVDALKGPLSNKMMAEITLKNTLLQLDKRAQEIPLYNMLQKKRHSIKKGTLSRVPF